MEAINATEHHGRTIAVDWSIPKTQYREVEENEKAATAKDEDTEMLEASNDEEESSSSSDDDNEDEESKNSDEESDDNDDEEVNSDAEIEEDVETKKAAKKTGPTSADGTTLFIRNLLFESTEEDLKQL
jgi:nucleolar protein 4